MSSSRTEKLRQVPEWHVPALEEFQAEILPIRRPAVLRGIARSWPLVVAALDDPHRSLAMLAAHATNDPIEILRADPEEQGRFHYRPDGRSLNFIRGEATLRAFLTALHEHESRHQPYAIVAQGLIAERYVPGFTKSHPMQLVPPSTEARLWIGNAAKIATHNDPVDNIAIVAVGRRRFTLFPPEAEANLYMGPNDPTPAGTRVSMVHVTAPDIGSFPLYAHALETALEAELSPGDAIFIPRDWFHHVEALEKINVLVNYWWDARKEAAQGPVGSIR
jgi:hypothetical protein